MELRERSDEVLMLAARAGSREALEVLVRRYSSRILTLLARLLGNSASAEEAFQETFCSVWASLKTYQTEAAFRPWLYAIAVNAARAHRKKATRHPTVELHDHAGGSGATGEESERASAARLALEKLPERQREVVVLLVYSGMSSEQVGFLLNCSSSTVRSHLSLGLKAMRTSLMSVFEDSAREESRS